LNSIWLGRHNPNISYKVTCHKIVSGIQDKESYSVIKAGPVNFHKQGQRVIDESSGRLTENFIEWYGMIFCTHIYPFYQKSKPSLPDNTISTDQSNASIPTYMTQERLLKYSCLLRHNYMVEVGNISCIVYASRTSR
jgi:hypothetical protein